MESHAMNKLVIGLVFVVGTLWVFAVESTNFGKIVGIETRSWGLHIQTDFAAGTASGCPVNVGDTYMYDFRIDNPNNSSPTANAELSIILAAFAAQKDIAFHIYGCSGTRPLIGYLRLR